MPFGTGAAATLSAAYATPAPSADAAAAAAVRVAAAAAICPAVRLILCPLCVRVAVELAAATPAPPAGGHACREEVLD